jgi:metallophosphoesterase (TIGR00282 family)
LIVANGENAADGFGITPPIVTQFLNAGVDVITSGNHIWQKREILPLLEDEARLLRPENYPKGAPGKGTCVLEKKGIKFAVVNLQGRDGMMHLDCPFQVGKSVVNQLRKETKIIIVDFHAESSREKEALGWYLDGKVSALIGTHTHVQTGDQRILPKGTAYLTDVGMIGPSQSVIGVDKSIAIQRSITQMPIKMEILDSPAIINGVLIEIEAETGKSQAISLVQDLSTV